jgi:hypothetical protein
MSWRLGRCRAGDDEAANAALTVRWAGLQCQWAHGGTSGEAPDSLASAMEQVLFWNSGSRDDIVADRREIAELRR